MRYLTLLLLFLTSCQCAPLRVRTEKVNIDYLASSHIPMVNLCTSCLCGEQLVIRYRRLCMPSRLVLSVRFADHCVETIEKETTSPSGYWVYRLANEQYQNKGPILGYKVELYQNEQLSYCTSHLWAEPINIDF